MSEFENYDDMYDYVQQVVDTLVELGWVEIAGVNDEGEFIYQRTEKMDEDVDQMMEQYQRYVDFRINPEQLN